MPAGKLFMMGDNRDDSADSRFAEMGFVSLENVEGRVETIVWSLYNCRDEPGLSCAKKRFFTRVR